jgi:predicted transcriptional regulator
VACVNPDGTIMPSAIAILTALRSADTAELIASATDLPLFRVRSALRELVAAGLVAVVDGHHHLTDAGLARL